MPPATAVGCETPSAILRPPKTRCDEPPHCQNYDRANDCPNETSVLASFIPPDRLAKVRCNESPTIPSTAVKIYPVGSYLFPARHPFPDPNDSDHRSEAPAREVAVVQAVNKSAPKKRRRLRSTIFPPLPAAPPGGQGEQPTHRLPKVTASVAYDGAVGDTATAAWQGGRGLGIASARLRAGTFWWYQMRGRLA